MAPRDPQPALRVQPRGDVAEPALEIRDRIDEEYDHVGGREPQLVRDPYGVRDVERALETGRSVQEDDGVSLPDPQLLRARRPGHGDGILPSPSAASKLCTGILATAGKRT